tara:strand:- start:1150 stop:1824 length:675 start_codon:yes stop_codon:yes gene_type:complete
MWGVFYFMKEYLEFLEIFQKAVLNAKRDIEEIELIAVSKKKPSNLIKDVINSGYQSFGENQIQEVENKWIELKQEFNKTRLHFVGNIQSKKTEKIFQLCDVIHSIDREKIVEKLKSCEEEYKLNKEYFIQINTGNEPQKSGVFLYDSESFIDKCINEYNLEVKGLMCIPPQNDNPEEHFLKLRDLGKNFNLPYLSMGMSDDFETAINCGATHIRVGTKIFGERS